MTGRHGHDISATGVVLGRLRCARDDQRAVASRLSAVSLDARHYEDQYDITVVQEVVAQIEEVRAGASAFTREIEDLRVTVWLAAGAYELASDRVEQQIEQAASFVAASFGNALPIIAFMGFTGVAGVAGAAAVSAVAALPVVLPFAFSAAAVGVAFVLILKAVNPEAAAMLGDAAKSAGVLTDDLGERMSDFWSRFGENISKTPAFGEAVRYLVESADDFLPGLLGIPAPTWSVIRQTMGDENTKALAASLAAAGFGAIAGGLGSRVGNLRVSDGVQAAPREAPSSVQQAAQNVAEQEADIKIDAYVKSDGEKVYFVYVSGTKDFAMTGVSGLDQLANLQNAAGSGSIPQPSGSGKALLEAMAKAGIEKSDEVVTVGHSQGGAAVANLIETGGYNVTEGLLFGAPVDQVKSDSTNVLQLQVAGDAVPWIGGKDAFAAGWDRRDGVVSLDAPAGITGIDKHAASTYAEALATKQDFVLDEAGARLAARQAGLVAVASTEYSLERD